jgi:3-hexulose-6-phosphate synthase
MMLGDTFRRDRRNSVVRQPLGYRVDCRTDRNGVGVDLQLDARRADPALFEASYLADVARALFERVGTTASVVVVGGLSIDQALALARAGLRAFVISGNLDLPDALARYGLPPDQIERHIADFIGR